MPPDIPLPRSLALLSLALPGVLLAGWELAAGLTRRRSIRQALAPIAAIALWLLSIHVAGLVQPRRLSLSSATAPAPLL